MTTLFSARIRMPHSASAIAPAPQALGVLAEPFAPSKPGEIGGIVIPALVGHGDTNGGRRFGGVARSNGSSWYRQDSAQLAGGGPLRG
ncbi:MAG: hypothetical protein JO306_04635 [Gemmatimonadetes bacterium]|nr:hypothetical protein [Gemmatimonadota bacterium]